MASQVYLIMYVLMFATAGPAPQAGVEGNRRQATLAPVRAYREAVVSFAQMGTMDVWYASLDEDELKTSIRNFRP